MFEGFVSKPDIIIDDGSDVVAGLQDGPLVSFDVVLREQADALARGDPAAVEPRRARRLLGLDGDDLELARKVAKELGERIYGLRQEIGFESISRPLDTALRQASQSKHWPVIVADQSDNTGGGAAGAR